MKHSFVGRDARTNSLMFVSVDAPDIEIAERVIKTNNPQMLIDTVQSPFTNTPSTTDSMYFPDVPSFDVDISSDDFSGYYYENPEVFESNGISRIENEFLKNQRRQYELFSKKNKDYGPANILDGDPADETNQSEALQRIYIRMQDKMSRLRKLIATSTHAVSDETIIDTLDDISNYANIATIVRGGNWSE